jgi:hypothetical protein
MVADTPILRWPAAPGVSADHRGDFKGQSPLPSSLSAYLFYSGGQWILTSYAGVLA